ncbi:helix-turn-helix transcriptional regulator [Couchioplanes azureus]|uniref:helix-turn-helix transcriptional regulator n=1 Tax=Couchioplanes caeruleus TaxID=56438 RepID=UPI001670FEA5|nr:LuxR family transcriptional regulator [Couchioplanes caeruleus]GGQ70034.1 LuxR family transcriptional regulator [Couchioplanes caeruleus subsp. azureus]
MIGRRHECAVVEALLAGSATRGGTLVICGEPGIGKTALLDHAASRAEPVVLRARGVESEAVLPFAALADLLIPIRRHFRDIPRVQRDALEGCLALSDRAEPNPYVVCAAALSVLAAAADASPVTMLVDDLQWTDPSSQRVLMFMARRLLFERAALLFTVRLDGGALIDPRSLPVLQLAGLSREESADLLRQHGYDPADRVSDKLHRLSAGNPLALLEAGSALRPAQLSGDEPIGELPLGRMLRQAWSCRIEELPDATRAALAVVAASHDPAAAGIAAALTAQGLSLDALGPAEATGMVVATTATIDFRHPILRAVVLQQTTLGHRIGACRALATVSSGAARAWYRAEAATRPDESVADDLLRAAADARGRGGHGDAARAGHRAAALTPDPMLRAGRMLEAARDAFVGGSSTEALSWCDEALAGACEPPVRADLELLRGRIRTWIGQPTGAHEALVAAARAIEPTDPARASMLLGEATLPAVLDGQVTEAVEHAQASVELARRSSVDPAPGRLMLGQAYVLRGDVAAGRALLEQAGDFLLADRPPAERQLLTLAGQCLAWADDPEGGQKLVNRVIDAARRDATPALLPLALAIRSEIECWAGRWAAASADAAEALRWAEESGQVSTLGYGLACLARLAALRGDRSRCEGLVSRARREVGPHGVGSLEAYLPGSLGLAALGHGELDAAISHLELAYAYTVERGVGNPCVVPVAADLVEAHVRAGNGGRAAEVTAWLHESAARTGLVWPAAAAARCAGVLAATAEEAMACFDRADLALRRRPIPFEQARTLLSRGAALRRARRPADARGPLLAAQAAFESLGATRWVRQAAGELAATGQRRGARNARPAVDRLSAQEMQVARAVGRGLTNDEAASTLFVSRKTVEAHLTRVYRKLGVRSRSELTRVLVSGGFEDGM